MADDILDKLLEWTPKRTYEYNVSLAKEISDEQAYIYTQQALASAWAENDRLKERIKVLENVFADIFEIEMVDIENFLATLEE